MDEILDRLTGRLFDAPKKPFETPQMELDIRALVAAVKMMREALKIFI